MLPTWMIEKLERDRRARDEQARPHLEVELPCPEEHEAPSDDEREPEHGAVTIEILQERSRSASEDRHVCWRLRPRALGVAA